MAEPDDPTTQSILAKETDARFWISTRYKPGQKLSSADPKDRAMGKVWNQIHDAVLAEMAAGNLKISYNRPEIQQVIKDMAVAQATAAAHLNAAVTTGDPTHGQLAGAALAVSEARANQGAVHQPASVDPAVAHAAATEVAAVPSHTAADHVATTVAARAPANAAAHHEHAAQSPPVTSTVDPLDLATSATKAVNLAATAPGDFVGVAIGPTTPAPTVVSFATMGQLGEWFNLGVTAKGAPHSLYLAAFNKHDAAFPHPVADGFAGEAALLVTAHADAPKHDGGSWWDRLRGEVGSLEQRVQQAFQPATPSTPTPAPSPVADGAPSTTPTDAGPVGGMSKGEKVGLLLGGMALLGVVAFSSGHHR